MQQNDLNPSVDIDTHAIDSTARAVALHFETQSLPPTSVSSSESSSVPQNTGSNISIPSPSSSSYDSLPRPHSQVQRSTSNFEMERQTPYDSALRDLAGRSHSASFDANDVPEELRQRPQTAAMSTPVSGEAVSSRLLQALPQLGIGQFLQDFTSQTSPWRGFATGRQDSEGEVDETGRLLPSQEVEEGQGSNSRRRLSSGASIDAISLNEDVERGDNVVENGVENAANSSTLHVENSTRERRNSEEESDDETAMDELQALFRRCHNSLPFVALFLIYFAYQHATGILVFVVGTVAVMGLDQRMRAQIALKDKANTWLLLGIVTMCAVDMVAICSVEGEPNPLHRFSQILQSKINHGSDSGGGLFSTDGIFWQVLWTVIVNDFLIRLWSIVVKAFVAGAKSDRFQCERKFRDEATMNADESNAPAIVIADEETDSATTVAPLTQQAVSTVAFYRRKRKLYGIIEMCSIFLRSLLASIPWCSFYQLCASKFMADVFTFAYLLIKGLILANQGRRIFILARSFVTLGLEFGVYVSHDELVEAGSPDCSICYESMKQPVKLACSHMFCEECVTEWFDHERSCPLCRASVESSGPTDAENVKPQFLDGRTSLVPQLL